MSLYLKRLHEHPDPEKPDPATAKVCGVKVIRANARHNFSPDLVQKACAEGWMTLGQGKITIHGHNRELVYRILRGPGRYCCHCKQELVDAGEWADAEKTKTKGQVHVATQHPDTPSPDSNYPAGYDWILHFECELESETPVTPAPASEEA